MANTCLCGKRHVPAEQFRAIIGNGLYIEWDVTCSTCANKPSVTLRNSQTEEVTTFSPNQVWLLFGGSEDQVGLMTI
jgi:hypothetical protein